MRIREACEALLENSNILTPTRRLQRNLVQAFMVKKIKLLIERFSSCSVTHNQNLRVRSFVKTEDVYNRS
ncbi:hypothetical protein LEP1GSC060_1401 [Leptospira weilii serovar Ranarum str. ICFT]|uniref:Uncharacterized protein n=1 Tax=Leptospira weilii serovar Ranarum str. ICFT TaxID=1218598 RepID=N1WQT1_9LEPT|nr:hypothetical protein LEP1GSC060_1401 [Leptospira weilii serovar Ranarum str. ICFT]